MVLRLFMLWQTSCVVLRRGPTRSVKRPPGLPLRWSPLASYGAGKPVIVPAVRFLVVEKDKVMGK